MLSADQLALRRTGLTATDMRELLAGNDLKVWLAKRDELPEEPETPQMRAGQFLEPGTALWAAHEIGVPIKYPVATVRHTPVDWALATPDAYVLDGEANPVALLELKVVGIWKQHAWREADDAAAEGPDSVPMTVAAQVCWQMAVTGKPYAYVAGSLRSGTELMIKKIERSDCAEVERHLWAIGETFWRRHVVEGRQPDLDGSDVARDFLRRKYPAPSLDLALASEDDAAVARAYQIAAQMERTGASEKARLQAVLCDRIGLHDGIQGDGWKATWRMRKGHVRPAVEIPAGRAFRMSGTAFADEGSEG